MGNLGNKKPEYESYDDRGDDAHPRFSFLWDPVAISIPAT
jgi:hypothetical protein